MCLNRSQATGQLGELRWRESLATKEKNLVFVKRCFELLNKGVVVKAGSKINISECAQRARRLMNWF